MKVIRKGCFLVSRAVFDRCQTSLVIICQSEPSLANRTKLVVRTRIYFLAVLNRRLGSIPYLAHGIIPQIKAVFTLHALGVAGGRVILRALGDNSHRGAVGARLKEESLEALLALRRSQVSITLIDEILRIFLTNVRLQEETLLALGAGLVVLELNTVDDLGGHAEVFVETMCAVIELKEECLVLRVEVMRFF